MLRLHTTVTSCKKLQKFHFSILVKLEKPYFAPGLGTFDPKTSKQDFSPKNCLCHIFKPLCYCNFVPKIKKVSRVNLIFCKTKKKYFGPISGPTIRE